MSKKTLEEVRAYRKEQYQKNKDKRAEYYKEYYRENAEVRRRYQRELYAKKKTVQGEAVICDMQDVIEEVEEFDEDMLPNGLYMHKIKSDEREGFVKIFFSEKKEVQLWEL